MKTFILAWAMTALLFPFHQAFAQSNQIGEISGRVQNTAKEPVIAATVVLLKAKDSSLVKGAITDPQGDYRFSQIPFGRYLISASAVGSLKSYTGPFTLAAKQETPDVITLRQNSQLLNSVQVKASRPFIEHSPGQTTVNVENSAVSAGNSVMEVLEKSPGVLVDQDYNITLNGKSGVNIMINGRPTHLSSSQLASVLKAMPAASVSKIELMTQPPAKYSAEGTAGLINIVLKKNTALGLNGSLSAGAGYGQYMKYNAGGAINYRNKHLSLYANYNLDHRKDKFRMDIDRRFYTPGTKSVQTTLSQQSTMRVGGNNHTAQLGMDYNINKDQTVGFVANGSFNQGNFNSFSPVNFLNPDGDLDSTSTSRNHTGYDWNNAGANLHYNWDIDAKGRSLTANLDYNRFFQSMPQNIETTATDAGGQPMHDPIQRKGKQPNHIDIYAAKIDYTHPLTHNAKVEAGLKSSYVHTDNNSNFFVMDHGNWITDPGNTNHFVYKENVNAAYVNFSKTFKKGWSTQVGLRGEQTTTHTDQLTTDSLNKNSYFELFPNLSLSKTLNPSNTISLSYSRRIDRPSYESLNPFIYYVDEYTYRVGNPYLKPQFVNSLELAYTFKQRYTAVLSYAHTNDIMAQVIRQIDSTHTTFQTQDNISKLDNLTLNLGIPVTITKWWSTYNSVMVFYNRYNGIYDGFDLNKGYTTFMVNTQQSFTLPSNWKAELSGMYRTSTILGPMELDPMGMISVGIQKSLWDDKASVKLNVQDVLQSMNINGKIDFATLNANTVFHTFRRAANLTFTWNFGNRKVKVTKYKNTGIQQETQRIQTGNSGSGQ